MKTEKRTQSPPERENHKKVFYFILRANDPLRVSGNNRANPLVDNADLTARLWHQEKENSLEILR